MVQTNELRIGNIFIVDEKGNFGSVLSISKPGYDYQCSVKYDDPDFKLIGAYKTVPVSELRPIPITPEVLARCGLQRDREGWILDFDYKLYDPLEINGVGVYGQVDRSAYPVLFKNKIMPLPVKFLHQLQNLVFALTGQEIKISEK